MLPLRLHCQILLGSELLQSWVEMVGIGLLKNELVSDGFVGRELELESCSVRMGWNQGWGW